MAKVLTRNNGRWTESRYESFIKSAIRSMSGRWPVKYDVLKAAQTEKKVNAKTGREAMHYECAMCKHDYPAKDVQVDHITPIVPLWMVGDYDWNVVIKNALCEAEHMQVLCKECHKQKSKVENDERRSNRKTGTNSPVHVSELQGECGNTPCDQSEVIMGNISVV